MTDNSDRALVVRQLGRCDYQTVWQQMQAFTQCRDQSVDDELWLLEHESVFTLGQAGDESHILSSGDIPIINVDRGGQVTYHGPGQLVVYLLLDLRRLKIGVRVLVEKIEGALIATLAEFGVTGQRRSDAPGVYVDDAKIAALGLRVRKGCSYHGLSLNIDADLQPFSMINPCGYQGLAVTRLSDLLDRPIDEKHVAEILVKNLCDELGYTSASFTEQPWSPG